MKKVLSLIAVAALTATFVACGPSKEELESNQKRVDDSINKAQADTLVAQFKRDSIAKVEADTIRARAERDTIAAQKAREEANNKKSGKKK